jgi:hypothetical protein
MEYSTTYNKAQRIVSQFNFDFARCHDVYRLHQLLRNLRSDLKAQEKDAADIAKELESAPYS